MSEVYKAVALDVDGVLADFNYGFIEVAKRESLGEHFPKTSNDIKEWYYADRDLIKSLFGKIAKDINFWLDLPGYEDTPKPLPFKPVAYITARPIENWVTAQWLFSHGFPKAPCYTVREPEDKLAVLLKLGSPAFVDDKQETVEYLTANGIRCYVFDRGWNQKLDIKYPRIKSLNELVMANEGAKFDTGKARWDLLPIDALDELVEVLTFGASKYADRNWEQGINYSRVYGAAMRHLTKFWKGQDKDEETGLEHLGHAMCCCMFLLSYRLRNLKEFDDRPV